MLKRYVHVSVATIGRTRLSADKDKQGRHIYVTALLALLRGC